MHFIAFYCLIHVCEIFAKYFSMIEKSNNTYKIKGICPLKKYMSFHLGHICDCICFNILLQDSRAETAASKTGLQRVLHFKTLVIPEQPAIDI